MVMMIETRLDELRKSGLFIYSRCWLLISCVCTTTRSHREYEHDQNRNDGAEWIHVKGDGRCLFAGGHGSEQ